MGRNGSRLALVVCTALALSAAPIGASTPDRKSPKSCLKALDKAEQIFETSAQVASAISDYFDATVAAGLEVRPGVVSDVTAFIEALGVATQTFTDVTNDASAQVGPLVPSYNAAAAKCRRGR